MSGNVCPISGPVFPCSVCAGNVTWRSRSAQCCTCSKWVQLRCSLLVFSRFKTLNSSHSWSFPLCCDPASSGDPTPTNTVSFFSDSSCLYTFYVLPGPSGPLSANAALPLNPRLQTSFSHSAYFVSLPSVPSPPPHVPGYFSLPPAPSFPLISSGLLNGMLGPPSQQH